MKKTVVAIWMFCYLALTMGVSVSFHYCMNKLDSTTIFATADKYCGNCGMHTDKSNGCCRDEVKVVKVEDDQKLTLAIVLEQFTTNAIAFAPSEFISTSFINAPASGSFREIPPPLLSEQDTFLQNGVFRI